MQYRSLRPGLLAATAWSLVLAGGAGIGQPAQASMTLLFDNQRSDAASVPVFMSFGGAGTLDAVDLATNLPMTAGTGYQLSALTQGIQINQIASGRIYVSLGVALTTPNSSNGYAANFSNATIGDFSTRWDKFEMDFTPAAGTVPASGGANLTATDFFSLGMKIATTGGTAAPTTLSTFGANATTIMNALGTLAGNTIDTAGTPTGAIAAGNDGVPVGATNAVRVIAPASVVPTGSQADNTVYPTMQNYIQYLQTGNGGGPILTNIAGANGQPVSTAFQTYELIALIANVAGTYGGISAQAGDLVIHGSINNGDGNGDQPYGILITAANLTDYAIFMANPGYTVAVGTDFNGLAAKVIADFYAGLNFGLIGSPAVNPNNANAGLPAGMTIGNSPSWSWYGNRPDGQPLAKLPVTDAYGAAQPGHADYYNQYAAYLTGVSDVYGFPYNDRLQSPLAPLSDNSVLTLTLLDDNFALGATDGTGGVLQTVPEPASLALLGLGLAGLAVARRRRG